MQLPLPSLDSKSKSVLRVLRDRKVASGWEIVKTTGLTPVDLTAAVGSLIANDLVETRGDCLGAEAALECYFNLRPSSSALANMVLSIPA
jgi:hypothetical protein